MSAQESNTNRPRGEISCRGRRRKIIIAVLMRLILASSSPRRKALLRRAGFRFRARASRLEPSPRRGEPPERYVRRAALAKALDVAASCRPGALVLGADTVVVLGGRILGKPAGPAEAARMLRRLSGRTHRVVTGVCLAVPTAKASGRRAVAPRRVLAVFHEVTRVHFRPLDEREIRAYVSSGEPLDKAGAYAIQSGASPFITRIEGCYNNVMGLPLARVWQALARFRPPADGWMNPLRLKE